MFRLLVGKAFLKFSLARTPSKQYQASSMKKSLIPLITCLSFASANVAAEKPNVLIFFIDDLGVTDIGVNGSSFYETPHIDALANSGVNFKNAYSSHPVCSPTRASLMTGKAPQRVGITQWISGNKPNLELSEVTIGEAFKEAGYRTGYIGKWHLGKTDRVQPQHQGFDHTVAVNRAGQPSSFFYPFGAGKRPTNVPDLKNYKKGDYLTDALTDKAIEYISEKSDKPFFLCFSHYAVHTPIQAPEALIRKYEEKRKEKYGDAEYQTEPAKYNTQVLMRQENPVYAAMMENLDTNVGRVMKALKAKGMLENTIVVFTSDNGGLVYHTRSIGPTSNQPYRSGKAWTYEGGVRIPTIISWPAKIKPLKSESRMITTDFYPTLLELCEIPLKPEQHLDGVSLKKVLHGEPDQAVEGRFLAWTYPHKHGGGHRPSHAILAGDWKLIRFDNKEPTELYNLAEDIGEKRNLAKNNPKKVKELNLLLDQWLEKTKPEK